MQNEIIKRLDKDVLPLITDLTQQIETRQVDLEAYEASLARYENRAKKLRDRLEGARGTEAYENLLRDPKRDPKSHVADRAKLAETKVFIEDCQGLVDKTKAEITELKHERTKIAWQKIHNEISLDYAQKKYDLIQAVKQIDVDWAKAVNTWKTSKGIGRYIEDLMPTDPKYLALPVHKVDPESTVVFAPQPKSDGSHITPLTERVDHHSMGPGVIGNLAPGAGMNTEVHEIGPEGSRFLQGEEGAK